MSYYARFTQQGPHLFRYDTRIYLADDAVAGPRDVCVAAVVGKNPGSAKPKTLDRLAPLDRGRDQLLPTVRGCFRRAYVQAGITIPQGAFVRVLNLFYLCDPNLTAALRAHATLDSSPPCETEDTLPAIVWFVWGPSEPQLDPMKDRFQTRRIARPFFVDNSSEKIHLRVPRPKEFARHTQGLTLQPVVDHVAQLLADQHLLG